MVETRVSQLVGLVETSAQQVATSQALLLVEIDQVQLRVSQALLLVEIEQIRPTQSQAGEGTQTGKSVVAVSPRAAEQGHIAFLTLAQSMATVAPQTIIVPAMQNLPGGGMSTRRTVGITVEVDWNRSGVFVNESSRVVSARGTHSLTGPDQLSVGGRGGMTTCSITLDNHDGRFSANNSASPLYAAIAAGGAFLAPVRVDVTIDGQTQRVFTGVLREIQENAGTATQAATAVLECRGREELLLQDKRSTPLGDFLSNNARPRTEDFHIVKLLEQAGLVDGVDFRSQAWAAAQNARPTIDAGIFPIRYVWLDDESLLDELWQLVAACCGWFYCDNDGIFHYHNITAVVPEALRRHYGNITTIELNETTVAGLTLYRPTAEMYADVTVEVAMRSPGAVEEIWTPDDVIVVPPNTTKTVWARLDAAQWREPIVSWAAYTAGGVPLSGGVTVTPTFYAQRIKLEIQNNNPKAAYLNTLRIHGQVLVGGRTLEVERSSTRPFWNGRVRRRRSIRNNIYIQTESQAETVAAYTLRRQELPVLTAQIANVDRHDVRIGWPVRIQYPDAVSASAAIVGMVTSVAWRVDQTGFRSDLTVLETGSLFAGATPLFVLGTNVLGDRNEPGEAYLFY